MLLLRSLRARLLIIGVVPVVVALLVTAALTLRSVGTYSDKQQGERRAQQIRDEKRIATSLSRIYGPFINAAVLGDTNKVIKRADMEKAVNARLHKSGGGGGIATRLGGCESLGTISGSLLGSLHRVASGSAENVEGSAHRPAVAKAIARPHPVAHPTRTQGWALPVDWVDARGPLTPCHREVALGSPSPERDPDA